MILVQDQYLVLGRKGKSVFDWMPSNDTYKGRVILVSIVPKISARWRQMDFCIFFCEKSRQIEKNVNKQLKISKQKSKQTTDKCKQIAEIVNKQLKL